MRILIACEYSGIVREAFKRKGHYAMSCDLLPTEIEGEHYQGDVFDIINDNWDMMIAFPPCTHLCVSGARWFVEKAGKFKKDLSLREDALLFVQKLMDANIDKICIENPVGVISSRIRKPEQIVNPYQFGHPESKRTCFWLKNLPLLKEADNVKHIYDTLPIPQKHRIWYMGSGKGKERSKTFQGIADAMAEQWS